MKTLLTTACIIVIGVFLGCSNIEHTTKVQQAVGEQRIAGIGDVILRIDRYRSLENAFGKSDLFGRKTAEGFTELRFAGVENNGEVVFYRKDVQILTNETTMSRTPITTTTGSSSSTASGSYYGTGDFGTLSASGTSNFTATTVSNPEDYHVVVPEDAVPIRVPQGEVMLPVSGYMIEIIRATSNLLEYKIHSNVI